MASTIKDVIAEGGLEPPTPGSRSRLQLFDPNGRRLSRAEGQKSHRCRTNRASRQKQRSWYRDTRVPKSLKREEFIGLKTTAKN